MKGWGMLDLPTRKTCFKSGFNYLAGVMGWFAPMPMSDVMRAPMVAMDVAKRVDVQKVICFARGDEVGEYAQLLRASLQSYGCQGVSECALREFMGNVMHVGVRKAWLAWDKAHGLSDKRGLHVYLSRSELRTGCRVKLGV